MRKKTKLLLFGASQGGVEMLKRLSRFERVLGFVDNDQKKHGERLKGYPIFDPASGLKLGYDYILISSVHYEAIEKQLADSGVNSERILSPSALGLREPFPWDGLIYLLVLASVGVGLLTALFALLS